MGSLTKQFNNSRWSCEIITMKCLVVFSLALFAVALAEPEAEAKAAAAPEADADPSAWYGYGGYGLGYRGYGYGLGGYYGGYYGRGYVYPYGGYGYGYYGRKKSPLKQNQKQKLAQMLGTDTEDMVDIMVATTAEVMVIHMEDTAMDIMAEKSDPLRLKLNQKLMPVPMLGMDMEATVIHTDTDTDVIMDTVVTATHMDTTDTTVECHAIETVPAKTTLPSSL